MDYCIERIRPESEQFDLLVTIYVDAFERPPWGERHRPADVRKAFERMLAYPEGIFLVTFDADSIPVGAAIAFAMDRKPELSARLSRTGKGLFVNGLFITPSAQKRGIGAALAAQLVSAARSERFDYAVVSTSVHARAIRHLFSDRHGFAAAFEEDYAGRHLLPRPSCRHAGSSSSEISDLWVSRGLFSCLRRLKPLS